MSTKLQVLVTIDGDTFGAALEGEPMERTQMARAYAVALDALWRGIHASAAELGGDEFLELVEEFGEQAEELGRGQVVTRNE
jgi:hypothetical protein